MISINLVCVGNLKEKFSKDEQAEYIKRLSPFCKINVVELKEQNVFDNEKIIVDKESELILEKLKGYNILCDIHGPMLSSEEFAKKLDKIMQENSVLTFVVGGSYGVNEKVGKACNEKISFSLMTFPHNMFRIMLFEQIYRAFSILNGKPYHK